LKRHLQFFGGVSAEFHACVQILRRLAVRVCLFLLFSGRGRWRRVRFRVRRSHVLLSLGLNLRSGCTAGNFLGRNLLANLALRRKQAPVRYSETFLLFFSHKLSLQCLQLLTSEDSQKWQSCN